MIQDQNFFLFDFYLSGIDEDLNLIKEIKNQKTRLDIAIGNVRWDELIIVISINSGNSKTYEVSFPEEITKIIGEIQQTINRLRHLEKVGDEILFAGEFDRLYCPIQVRNFDKRIHIGQAGIPRSIRGLGLGVKIYRAIIEAEDLITSNATELYGFGKLLWNSLRKSELVFTFFTKTHGYCFASDSDVQTVLDILSSKINNQITDHILWDETFFGLYRDEILRSPLARFVEEA